MARRKVTTETTEATETTEDFKAAEIADSVLIGNGGAVFCKLRCVAASSAVKSSGSLATGAGTEITAKHTVCFRGIASPALSAVLHTSAGEASSIPLQFPDMLAVFDTDKARLQFEGSFRLSIVKGDGVCLVIASVRVNDCDCPFTDLADLMKESGNLYMLAKPERATDLFQEGDLAPQVAIHCQGEPVALTQAHGPGLYDEVDALLLKVVQPGPAPLLELVAGDDGLAPWSDEMAADDAEAEG